MGQISKYKQYLATTLHKDWFSNASTVGKQRKKRFKNGFGTDLLLQTNAILELYQPSTKQVSVPTLVI